eukprot:m.214368 g.214368  ORF g.214368 m.214368 type:complete len:1024 (+) comp17194_c0_seq1:62-3133(+)
MSDRPSSPASVHSTRSTKRSTTVNTSRDNHHGMPTSRSPCSPILSKRRPRLVQPPCVVGANYLGQATSNVIKFSQVPSELRDALLEQSISACLRADDSCRVSAAATITVAGERLEITTHAPPPLVITWLKANTAYCGRCERYPRCFGIIRSLAEGVYCEVFASETEDEAARCVVVLARSFGAQVQQDQTALTSNSHMLHIPAGQQGRHSPVPEPRAKPCLTTHLQYHGFVEISQPIEHVCSHAVQLYQQSLSASQPMRLELSSDQIALFPDDSDDTNDTSPRRLSHARSYRMSTVKQVGTCVDHPQFVYLARTKPGALYTFVHVMELSCPEDAARLCLLSLKMMERYEPGGEPDVGLRGDRMHKALHGVRPHHALDVLQSRLELETDETQTKLRELFGQQREALDPNSGDESLVHLMVGLMAEHLPVDVVETTTQRLLRDRSKSWTIRRTLAASLDNLLGARKERVKRSGSNNSALRAEGLSPAPSQASSPQKSAKAIPLSPQMAMSPPAVRLRTPKLVIEDNNLRTPLRPTAFRHSTESARWREELYEQVTSHSPRTATPGRKSRRSSMFRQSQGPPPSRRDIVLGRWRKAVQQQLLLNRMHRENARLEAEANAATLRAKTQVMLDRQERQMAAWQPLLNEPIWLWSTPDLQHAAALGIPDDHRALVWQKLAERLPSLDEDLDVPYLDLLVEPCIYLHAVKIDVDRAFPQHPLFQGQNSAGQQALFNSMKAYSVLDEECGYCQGMSFLGGLLIMHLTEDATFRVFTKFMYGHDLRQRYLPDMQQLRCQLFQLSSLIHDHLPNVYDHFLELEVEPFLYATPWFLTFFSTNFSIPFAKRVLDMVAVSGGNVLFLVTLALLEASAQQPNGLLQASSFERVLHYLQTDLPKLADEAVDDILLRAMDLKVDNTDLQAYAEDYASMQDGLGSVRSEGLDTLTTLRTQVAEVTVKFKAADREMRIAQQQVNHAKSALQSMRRERDHALEAGATLQQQLTQLQLLLLKNKVDVPKLEPVCLEASIGSSHA